MNLVPEGRISHERSSTTLYEDVIDLSLPRRFTNYDKLKCGNLLISVKVHPFGNRHIRLTKKHCEEFLDDDRDFVMSEEFRQEMQCIFR
jgi:hypothetical protein